MTNSGKFRLVGAAALALVLAGCAGGGDIGADGGLTSGTLDVAGRDALASEFGALSHDFYGRARGGHTVAPETGSATFNGIAAFGEGASGGYDDAGDPDLIAEMAMTVDFGLDRVRGAMWDFHDRDGNIAGGSVQLTGVLDGIEVKAYGEGTLDWGDRKQDIEVGVNAYLLYDTYGIQGNISPVSHFGTDNPTGIVLLKNDSVQ